MRTRLLIGFVVALAFAPLARADGLPLSDSGVPAVLHGSDGSSYAAVATARGTLVTRLGDVVEAKRFLDGRWTVPVVGLDGTASGLSADRSTLVLINPRRAFPRPKTSFTVLDAQSLRLRSKVLLDGDYSFDAQSPDGSLMYLIHYQSRRDPTRYEVRAYDLVGDHGLLPEPIVDPTEADEQMRGFPITRVTTPDGRFAYTLYDGAGKEPFVHALDTVNGEARCIDLEELAGREDLYSLGLDLTRGGTRLAVVSGTQELAAIDTRTYRPPARAAVATPSHSSGSRLPIVAFAPVTLLVAAAVVFLRRRRTRSRAYETSAGST
ncbi:MAG TPA: hypothetical protein VFW80_12540 [Gaiellaceae bacterium]|nr:hypothetical protein [Gaiellaceae bacterium]